MVTKAEVLLLEEGDTLIPALRLVDCVLRFLKQDDLETGRIQENFNILHKFSVLSVQDYNMILPDGTPAGAGPGLGAGAHLPRGEEAQDLGGSSQGPGQGETTPDPGGTLGSRSGEDHSYSFQHQQPAIVGEYNCSIFMEDTGIYSAGG